MVLGTGDNIGQHFHRFQQGLSCPPKKVKNTLKEKTNTSPNQQDNYKNYPSPPHTHIKMSLLRIWNYKGNFKCLLLFYF